MLCVNDVHLVYHTMEPPLNMLYMTLGKLFYYVRDTVL